MKSFIYTMQASRVLFGVGSLGNLEREIVEVGAQRALVLSTPEQRPQAEEVASRLGNRAAGVFAEAVMHVPIESARAARNRATELGADCAVALGGGSTTGLAKAIALESALPIIAIPTTYAGSEMTTIYGITENGVKRTGRDARVLPRTVIYDPALTTSLPVGLSAASGMNAIAHAAEGLYARDTNPIISLLAEEGIRAMAVGLGRVAAAPNDLEVRSDCLYGAWLCGIVLGSVDIALHHKLCHTLGGSFNLPHAETHSVVLPHAIAFNAAFAPEAMQRICRALGSDSAAAGLFDLAKSLGLPLSLRDLGLAAHHLDRAATLAMSNPYWNPRPFSRVEIRELLQHAFEGVRPS
jgi:alcohol dehydrogenase class IV